MIDVHSKSQKSVFRLSGARALVVSVSGRYLLGPLWNRWTLPIANCYEVVGLVAYMTADKITSIQRGIIFIMAEWSGQAKWAYKHLAEFLAQHGDALEHLVTIDIDQQPYIGNLPELSGKIHGYGEVAVVRDGHIVFVAALGREKSLIQNRCEELLRFYEA